MRALTDVHGVLKILLIHSSRSGMTQTEDRFPFYHFIYNSSIKFVIQLKFTKLNVFCPYISKLVF